ncbi:S16 family serine protease [Roseimicrobium sp. ORNL1]|uniref:S16 family serine protease n=1 Tax=Roseimicrobium sp. ORNL1 TaxID=2711231 RepID=UPI00197F70F2|nr:S16 family serine protease [Roseimicrobium sp. ORNL1]
MSLFVISAEAPAQTTSDTVYCNVSTTIPVGRYESAQPIYFFSGPILNNSPRGLFPQPLEVSMSESTEVNGVSLTICHTNFRARNVVFKGGTIDVSVGGRASFEDCVFDGVTFMMSSGLPANQSPNSTEPRDRFRAHLELKNSVLNKAQFQVKGGPDTVMGLKMENCTMYGPGSMLPMLLSRPGLLANLKAAQTEVKNCAFIQCSYSSPFLAITQQCSFDSCTLVPGLPLAEITTVPLQIPADFHPIETADQITAQLPQYTIVPLDPAVPTGSKLGHSFAKGEVSLNQLPSVLPMKPLASVLPAPSNTTLSTNMPPRMPTTGPTFTTPISTNAVTSPTLGAPDTGLKLNQTNVHGLLIMSLGSGEAGSASKMAAIALKGYSTDAPTVRFNQPVGAMMAKALQEVTKFTQVNQGGWPAGYQIELSFADKYSNKDGPSAAVACALLLHSLITGKELDQAFAVTGDMNADGSVQPIGGVAAKIRGATKGHCKIIGIPIKNESSLGDLLLSDGPGPFASIQIYSLQHFRDAEALATADKPAATQAAIEEMSRVQEVLLRNPGQMGNWLRNQHVISKLQQVLQDSPNNLSAKYLLMYASGKVPQTLTLAGSLSAIDDAAGDLLAAIKSNQSQSNAFDTIGKASVGSSITRMQALRTRCDARVRPYADAIISFGTAVKEAQDRPPQSVSRAAELRSKINIAASSANSTYARIINDPVIREELEK